jgi:proline iminopeptidase
MRSAAALLAVALGAVTLHAAHSDVQEGYLKAGEGVYLFYQKIGNGKQVVIVPLRQFLFEPLAKLASNGRTLIFYDVRNRGYSTAVAEGSQIGIQHDVEDVEIVRAHFGVQRFTLVGFSYAGLMVAMYAMEHPERIERLIQLGPVPLKYPTKYANEFMPDDADRVPDPAELAKLQDLRRQGLEQSEPKEYCEREWAVQRFQLVGDPAHVDRLGKGPCGMPNEWPINLERHFKYHFASVQRLSIDPQRIAAIKQPVLIIHGTKDRNAYYGAEREWSMMLPHGLLLTVKGAAHCAWADAPEVVIPAIDGFLRGRAPAGAEKIHFFMPTPN